MNRARLDPDLNYWPPSARRVHLMGVCGTGMAALAGMLQERGLMVTGSDENVYPPMSDFLAALEIPVAQGYRPQNLDYGPDVVVVGNVITPLHLEARGLMERRIPYVSMAQALGRMFLGQKQSITIAGTHGKTTTAGLTAYLLDAVGLDPSFLVGGLLGDYGRNFRIGQGPHFVIEGDEYDTAFFDKGPKFMHYRPRVAVIGAIEFDHADIYNSLEDILDAFARFIGLVPADGLILACGDDDRVMGLVKEARCPVQTFGLGSRNHIRADSLEAEAGGTGFEVFIKGGRAGRARIPLWGGHNVQNTLAAIGVGLWAGVEPNELLPHLSGFGGVKRRQEIVGAIRGVSVVDDFAHHPTAVKKTVDAVQKFGPPGRLIAVFEPRSNTSIRNIYQSEYAAAFDRADLALISRPQNYKGLEEHERLDVDQLIEDISARGSSARAFDGATDIIGFLVEEAGPGDIVLIMSNGGFDNIHRRLLKAL